MKDHLPILRFHKLVLGALSPSDQIGVVPSCPNSHCGFVQHDGECRLGYNKLFIVRMMVWYN